MKLTAGEKPVPRDPKATLARLASFFSAGHFEQSAQFYSELNARRDFHLSRLAARPQLCSAINDAMTAVDYFTKDGELKVHPCWSQNICSILYLLLLDYEGHGASAATMAVTEAAFCAAVRYFLKLSVEQADKLCDFLLDIRDRFAGMALRNTRFLLLELPIGNSLAIRLLEDLLRPLLPVVTLKAVLNRNDWARDGITREALLAAELEGTGLKRNDLVVLVDEWKTGTNFYHVCQRLVGILPAESFFFPFAFLEAAEPRTEKAKKRFAGYATKHDAILGKVGFGGAEFRRRLPAIDSSNLFRQYFFWAENDRMAGYRKMQVHGSFFSSIDGTVELFRSDSAALEEVLRSVWEELMPKGRKATEAEFDEVKVTAYFSECLSDYMARRDELEHCADGLNAGGVLNDEEAQSHFKKVFDRMNAVVTGRPASLVIDAAKRYLEAKGGLDPIDCYYFDGHAPIVATLGGRAALWHKTTLDFLNQRMQARAMLR